MGKIKFIKVDDISVGIDVIKKSLESQGYNVKKFNTLTDTFTVEVDDSQITTKHLKKVNKKLPCNIINVLDDFTVETRLYDAMDIVEASWVYNDFTFSGKGMRIGIVDTGIDTKHPAFSHQDYVYEKDFTDEGNGDSNGHGTHVSHIAVGSFNEYVGAAFNATLYMAKALDSQGSGSASGVVDSLEWLVEQEVDVISMSLGAPASTSKDILQLACEAAVDLGIPVFVAAGNSGPYSKTIDTPGVNSKVITVASSNKSGSISNFSSRGPTINGENKPDITGVGEGIVAAKANSKGLTTKSGTSMSTPLVASCGVIIMQAYFEKFGVPVSPNDLKNLLQDFAQKLTEDIHSEGSGEVRLATTIEAILDGNDDNPEPKPEPEPPENPPIEKPNLLWLAVGILVLIATIIGFILGKVL